MCGERGQLSMGFCTDGSFFCPDHREGVCNSPSRAPSEDSRQEFELPDLGVVEETFRDLG